MCKCIYMYLIKYASLRNHSAKVYYANLHSPLEKVIHPIQPFIHPSRRVNELLERRLPFKGGRFHPWGWITLTLTLEKGDSPFNHPFSTQASWQFTLQQGDSPFLRVIHASLRMIHPHGWIRSPFLKGNLLSRSSFTL